MYIEPAKRAAALSPASRA